MIADWCRRSVFRARRIETSSSPRFILCQSREMWLDFRCGFAESVARPGTQVGAAFGEITLQPQFIGNPPPLAVRLEEALPIRRLLVRDARLRSESALAPEGPRIVARGVAQRNPWSKVASVHSAPEGRRKCHRSGTLPPPLRGGGMFDAICAHGLRFAPPVATVLRPCGGGLIAGPFQGPSLTQCPPRGGFLRAPALRVVPDFHPREEGPATLGRVVSALAPERSR